MSAPFTGGYARGARIVRVNDRQVDCGSHEIGALSVQARRAGFRDVRIRGGVLLVDGQTVETATDLERLRERSGR